MNTEFFFEKVTKNLKKKHEQTYAVVFFFSSPYFRDHFSRQCLGILSVFSSVLLLRYRDKQNFVKLIQKISII